MTAMIQCLVCLLAKSSIFTGGNVCLSSVGACEIERVQGEWLVVLRCDANDACLQRVLWKSSV